VTDFRDRVRNARSREVLDNDPDWMMLFICAALLIGWAAWLGVIAYRLLMT
jgi:hypothetical protein